MFLIRSIVFVDFSLVKAFTKITWNVHRLYRIQSIGRTPLPRMLAQMKLGCWYAQTPCFIRLGRRVFHKPDSTIFFRQAFFGWELGVSSWWKSAATTLFRELTWLPPLATAPFAWMIFRTSYVHPSIERIAHTPFVMYLRSTSGVLFFHFWISSWKMCFILSCENPKCSNVRIYQTVNINLSHSFLGIWIFHT